VTFGAVLAAGAVEPAPFVRTSVEAASFVAGTVVPVGAASPGSPRVQLPLRQKTRCPVHGSMRHEVPLPAHLGLGDVLANGRHEQTVHESENVRQSASVLQAVDVPGSALDGEAPGTALASAMGFEGAGGCTTTGATGIADAAGEGSRSLRLQATAKKTANVAHPTIMRDDSIAAA
jgi:hypothetical protein